MRMESTRWTLGRWTVAASWVLVVGLTTAPAQQPAKLLHREDALREALASNPYLATIRKQCGYAEAALVIARTYPYNPVYTGYFAQNSGPVSADITNRVFLEQYVALEIELRGQGKHRQAVGAAAASRIEWEIAQQEIAVSIATIRAYNTVLYRQAKLQLVEEGIKLGEQAFEQTRKSADAGKIKATDLLLARVDLDSAKAQSGQARTALAVARSELRRQLGTLDDNFIATDDLDVPLLSTDQTALTRLALDQRADLHARRCAITEAEAALRLIVANRYGNPSLAPFFSYDPTRVATVGGRISMPLTIFNTKKGEIIKAQTDVAKIQAEVEQMELQASQDVQAALARWTDANKWAAAYQTDVLPNLLKARQEIANEPGVDLARKLTVQRTFIKANENLFDARYELSQAQADLALSVSEPALAIGPGHLPAAQPMRATARP